MLTSLILTIHAVTLFLLRVFGPSRRIKYIYIFCGNMVMGCIAWILSGFGKLMQKLVGNGPRQQKYRDLNVLQKDDVVQNVSIANVYCDYIATNKRCLHHVCISLLFILKYCKANQELEFRKYEYASMSLLTLQ
ncbi:hypothetical protein CMV_027399, partial [Castanea mollissima]